MVQFCHQSKEKNLQIHFLDYNEMFIVYKKTAV